MNLKIPELVKTSKTDLTKYCDDVTHLLFYADISDVNGTRKPIKIAFVDKENKALLHTKITIQQAKILADFLNSLADNY